MISGGKTMQMTEARIGLTKVWFAGGLPFLFVMIVQTILGAYGSEVNKAWGWALPTIMPTLLLIVGVLVGQQMNANPTKATVDPFLYKLTYWLSVFYLAAVILTVLLAPFADRTKIEVMQTSNLFLGPLQGLVGAAFGAFFVARKDEAPGTAATDPQKPV
jgi:hypothetical protein